MQVTPILVLDDRHCAVLRKVKKYWATTERVDWICYSCQKVTEGTPFTKAAKEIEEAISVALSENSWLNGWVYDQFLGDRGIWEFSPDYRSMLGRIAMRYEDACRMAWVDRMLDLGYIA